MGLVVGEVAAGPPPPKHPLRDATKTPLHSTAPTKLM
jgi:hypothetical protein